MAQPGQTTPTRLVTSRGGQLVQADSEEMRRLAEQAATQASGYGVGGSGHSYSGQAGMTILPPTQPLEILAMIEAVDPGGEALYSWVEAEINDDGEYVAAGTGALSGSYSGDDDMGPARDLNGNVNIPAGTFVRLRQLTDLGGFEIVAGAGGGTVTGGTHISVASNVVNWTGHNYCRRQAWWGG